MDAKIIGQRLRLGREELGLSQEQLAGLVQRPQQAISDYENGTRNILAADLPEFARVLGKPVIYFFEGELSETDLDRALVESFHRLGSMALKQDIIRLIQDLSDVIDQHTD